MYFCSVGHFLFIVSLIFFPLSLYIPFFGIFFVNRKRNDAAITAVVAIAIGSLLTQNKMYKMFFSILLLFTLVQYGPLLSLHCTKKPGSSQLPCKIRSSEAYHRCVSLLCLAHNHCQSVAPLRSPSSQRRHQGWDR